MRSSIRWFILLAMLLVAPQSSVGAQVTASDLTDYHRAVSDYFKVDLDEVHIISEWRVAPRDIPVVFFLSRSAGISADATAAERARGSSWLGLMRRYGVRVSAVHFPFAAGAELGSLSVLYERLAATPRSAWNRLDLSDEEVSTLINVRMLSSALGVPPARILQVADSVGGMVRVQRALAGG